MITVIIIEDEPLVANDLRKLLGEVMPAAQVAAVLPSVSSARQWFAQHPEPDLLFADIQLSDGVSFDLFGEPGLRCPVIFTTAYDEYALRAFKLNSIDYLLKPIDREELKSALDKYHRLQHLPDSALHSHLAQLLKDLQPGAGRRYKERFLVQVRNRTVPLGGESVACFYREEIIFLVTHAGQRYISEFSTLEEAESLLDPARFFRANRQYILQLGSVGDYSTHATGKLTVHLKPPLNLELDISREKAAAFRHWLAGE